MPLVTVAQIIMINTFLQLHLSWQEPCSLIGIYIYINKPLEPNYTNPTKFALGGFSSLEEETKNTNRVHLFFFL